MPEERTGRKVWQAGLYDERHSFVWRHGSALLDLLSPQAGERVLDVGSGTGELAALIAERGASVLGIDADAAMVEKAKSKFPALNFAIADITTFTSAEPFDAVFSNATLHWVMDARAAVRSIADALKPGGRLVAELGGQGNIQSVIEAVAEARHKHGLDSPSLPWFFPSLAEYAAILEDSGLLVSFASLFDRPTHLEEGPDALRDWLEMFASDLLADLEAGMRSEVIGAIELRLRPTRFSNGIWVLDYRRLRVVAEKR